MSWSILTLIGADKPGIVAAVTGSLFSAGCSLAQASMMRLGANFAIMLRVSHQPSDNLRGILHKVCHAESLHLHIDEDSSNERFVHSIEPNIQVTLYGADRSGLVAQLTEALAREGLNIIDLQTELGGTAEQPIYILTLEGYLEGSSEQGIEQLQQALQNFDTDVQINIDDINTLRG